MFKPARAFFEPDALNYPLGKQIQEKLIALNIPIETTPSHNRVTKIPGETSEEKYVAAKRTLVVGVRRTLKFQTCKPSAHYQLPLVTSCPGLCEYCYLQTTLGPKPAVRLYVNIDEILAKAKDYMKERAPEITRFEGAATSDPIPVEHLSGSLRLAIEFFGQEELGRFRFVTKYSDVDSLLDATHQGHTEIRFSINTEKIIKDFEKGTAGLAHRLAAASKVAKAGYPLGFIIAPIILYDDYQEEYYQMLRDLRKQLPQSASPSFELITHRFTAKAKRNILAVFPGTKLPLDEQDGRQFKYGQFGYGKYVYSKENMAAIKEFFFDTLNQLFPASHISYLV